VSAAARWVLFIWATAAVKRLARSCQPRPCASKKLDQPLPGGRRGFWPNELDNLATLSQDLSPAWR
jgi:hypothetical protein